MSLEVNIHAAQTSILRALQKPVYCMSPVIDEMLTTQIRTAGSVFEILETLELTSF